MDTANISRDVYVNTNTKVSVIVPVYNSEKYLRECIDSLRNQSLREIEIILVDDGSKDGSASICDELAKVDKRIVVIHQANKGICGARNTGLKKATGEYVSFCDNDDYVEKDCYELAYKQAIANGVDIVRFKRKHTIISKLGTISTGYADFDSEVVEINDWADYIELLNKTGYGVWAGIYKRSLLNENKIVFKESIWYGYEDHIFVSETYKYTQSVYLLNKELYDWRQRVKHSTSTRQGYDVFLNRIAGILRWKSVEDEIYDELTDQTKLHTLRLYDYMKIVFEEILGCGLHGKQVKSAVVYAKENLGFKGADNSTIENRLLNSDKVRLYMFSRYFNVVFKKFKRFVQK